MIRSRLPRRHNSLNPLAGWVARRIWFGLLWWMRRPFIKRMRRGAPNLLPEHKRAQAWENIKRQDAWAMRHGLTLLTAVVNLFFVSVFFTAVYMGALSLMERGAFAAFQRDGGVAQ